ncbi:hypothetical protein SLEP1_g5908 [Rubroshorea leprosula]|uniref:protein-serine/threonine phosphatase n=1 Tax=Rubroshorea leprosula TaxID=152421 RepID=A0AAV5HXU3_9ROSI|nr:hypothetical protein SLEP1_g5908 [Rubroshorea leprosula]
MRCALMVPTSPLFSPSTSRSPSAFCKSEASSFCPSPRVHGPQASTTLITTPRSPSFLTEKKQPLSGSVAGGVAMKWKRPGRIEIPALLPVGMGFAAETQRGEEEVRVEGEGYSVYCKRGSRRLMEDRYSAVVLEHDGDSKQAFFGVFDGHGGVKAAEFVAKNLGNNITEEVSNRRRDDIEGAIRDAYLTTDREFLKQRVGGGTCCVTALIQRGDLVVSNAGDCRAVMSRGGVADAVTSDHQPSRQDERDRIEALGGYVDCCRGVWRVHGSLAVSRAIGDQFLKRWVIAEPETKVLKIKPDCEFLILASDGLWNKVSNQEAVDLVRSVCVGVEKPNTFSACKKLAELSSWRGSLDDISVMIIQLNHFVS